MSRRAPVISRLMLITSVTVIAALAAAPFLVASIVSERRIDAAIRQAAEIARTIDRAAVRADGAHVRVGRGTLPQIDEASGWAAGSKADLKSPADPWRNAYLVNAGAAGAVWVLSAGPNGIVDTPFEGAAAAHGDDVTARVR